MATALPLETDPRDLLLDANNDLVVTSDLAFTTGVAAIAQECRIRLQMFRGEWFLDLDAGIPYWQGLIGQKPAAAIKVAQIEFRKALQAVPGVLSVSTLNVTHDRPTRGLKVTWQVKTAFGETPPDSIVVGRSV